MVVLARPKSAYIVINTERCKGCRLCLHFCPKEIIGLASQVNKTGYIPAEVIAEKAYECTGCAACAIMCPDTAITVYRHKRVSSPSIS